MKCCVATLLAFLAVFGIVVANSRNRHAYLHHLRRVERFQSAAICSVPKETIVQLSAIAFDRELLADEKMSPTITVLHRCESCSGCYLQPDYSCTAKSQEVVELTFFVTSVKGPHKEYRIGRAANHTSCWCQPNEPRPK